MTNRLRTLLLLVIPLAVAFGVIYAQAPGAPQEVQEAVSHVPFSADSEIVTATGQIVVGRFYRRSDGSTRSETGATRDSPTLVFINNYQHRKSYMWRVKDGAWIAYPMEQLAPPPRWVPDQASLAKMTRVEERVDGLELLKKGKGDRYDLLAPALGYWPVVERGCSDEAGRVVCVTKRKFNIRTGEPPSALFEPNAGDALTESSTPFPPLAQRK